MSPFVLQLLSAFVASAAGFSLYVYVVNRYRRHIKMPGFSFLISLMVLFLLVVLGSGIAGFLLAPGLWLTIPFIILSIAVFREIQRHWLRTKYRASPPVETHNMGMSIARPVTTRDVALLRYHVHVPGLPLKRLRVALLSDLHVGNKLGLDYYKKIFDAVNAHAPDIMALAGDFVTKKNSLPWLPPVLQLCQARLGVFAVLGNHDFWSDPKGVANALSEAGISLLQNTSSFLQVDDARVWITGYDSPWSKTPWQPPEFKSGELVIALAHSADNIYRLSKTGITAVLCGHYHAGQARVPGWGSVFVPSRYGRRFDHGHFLVNGTHLFVSAGLGASGLLLRIYCQPDVFLIDFTGGAS